MAANSHALTDRIARKTADQMTAIERVLLVAVIRDLLYRIDALEKDREERLRVSRL